MRPGCLAIACKTMNENDAAMMCYRHNPDGDESGGYSLYYIILIFRFREGAEAVVPDR